MLQNEPRPIRPWFFLSIELPNMNVVCCSGAFLNTVRGLGAEAFQSDGPDWIDRFVATDDRQTLINYLTYCHLSGTMNLPKTYFVMTDNDGSKYFVAANSECSDRMGKRCHRIDMYAWRMGSNVADDRKLMGQALDRHEIFFAYQKVVSLAEPHKVIGYEALARWHHNGAMVLPVEFIPKIIGAGLETALIKTQIDHLTEVSTNGFVRRGFWVSMNLSQFALRSKKVLELLLESDHALSGVHLEISEECMSDIKAMRGIRQLRNAGYKVGIDDFGTGYSNLRQLLDIEDYDYIKIAREMVEGCQSNSSAQIVIKAVADISRQRQIFTVAEGVTQESEARALVDMGCNYAQGWLYGTAGEMPET
jgi:EAL domain-containing protein (putative c-di-GMP-specific phosphodiesterase class I)